MLKSMTNTGSKLGKHLVVEGALNGSYEYGCKHNGEVGALIHHLGGSGLELHSRH